MDVTFLGATSAVMPVKYVEIMKQVPGVREVTPVLNWLVPRIKGESRAVCAFCSGRAGRLS